MRRTAVACVAFWLVSALFLGIGAIAANPAGDAEGGFVGRIGDERAAGGLAGYVVAPDLVEVARRHAAEMARQQRLHHNPRLADDVQGWQAVGENVGVGPSVEAIHQKFMESPTHRDNILSGRYTEIGVGVVADGADLWVVQVFRLPQSAAPAEPGPNEAPVASEPGSGSEPAPAGTSTPGTRPAAGPAPASGGGTVRAAANGGGTVEAASTSTPAPVTPPPPAAPAEVRPGSQEFTTVPSTSTSVAASAAPPAASSAADLAVESPESAAGATVLDTDVRSATDREVTLPVAVAATMLLGVVTALAVHVGGARVRSLPSDPVGPRRRSLLDTWELALAG